MMVFGMHDRQLLNTARFDSSLTPRYDYMRDCLTWDDESPPGLTREGFLEVTSLWGARGILHRENR